MKFVVAPIVEDPHAKLPDIDRTMCALCAEDPRFCPIII